MTWEEDDLGCLGHGVRGASTDVVRQHPPSRAASARYPIGPPKILLMVGDGTTRTSAVQQSSRWDLSQSTWSRRPSTTSRRWSARRWYRARDSVIRPRRSLDVETELLALARAVRASSLSPQVDHFGDRGRDECEREKQGKGTNGARTHVSVTTD